MVDTSSNVISAIASGSAARTSLIWLVNDVSPVL
jgi:hypothetical protein